MTSKIIPYALLLCGLAAGARAQQIEIKMATLAPKDSPWCDVLVRMGERWKTISNGNVKLTLYAGGVMGDEPDTVNKLRIKLIQAVAPERSGSVSGTASESPPADIIIAGSLLSFVVCAAARPARRCALPRRTRSHRRGRCGRGRAAAGRRPC